jgi:lysine 6-dehydrogenase
MKIIVLGGGLVGGPMARDLAADDQFEVTVADRDEQVLADLQSLADITPLVADLSDPASVTALVADYDFVVDAVPGHLGFQTLKAIIEAGKNVIDIAFSPKTPSSWTPWPNKTASPRSWTAVFSPAWAAP